MFSKDFDGLSGYSVIDAPSIKLAPAARLFKVKARFRSWSGHSNDRPGDDRSDRTWPQVGIDSHLSVIKHLFGDVPCLAGLTIVRMIAVTGAPGGAFAFSPSSLA